MQVNAERFFSQQARKPTGWFGRFVMPLVFDRGNAFLNGFTEQVLALQPADRVLEIGCGTGKLISRIVSKVQTGCIEGIDFSPAMVALARKRNRKTIARGTVSIVEGDFDGHPYPENHFDAIYSVNTIYFWKNPEQTLDKAMSILVPGGRLVVAFEDRAQLAQRKLSPEVFRLYSADDARRLLESGGMAQQVEIVTREKSKKRFHCAVAKK